MKLLLPTILLLATTAALPAQFSTDVLLPGDPASGVPAGDQRDAAVALGSPGPLLVWIDNRVGLTQTTGNTPPPASNPLGSSTTDVYARRYDAAGQPIDPFPTVVTRLPYSQSDVDVSWNGTDWLVVFVSQRWTGFFTTRGIYAVRVSGATGEALDPEPILIDDDADVDESDPSVTSDGSDWIVSWYDEANAGLNRLRRLLKIRPDGSRGAAAALVDTMFNDVPLRSRMAFGAGRVAFVAESQGRVIARLFDPATLAPTSPERVLANSGRRPAVTSDGVGFLVGWREDAVFPRYRGTTLSSTGAVGTGGGAVWATAAGGSADVQPELAWDGTRYWLAVDERQTGQRAVQGWRIDTSGANVDTAPFVLSATATPDGSVVAGNPATGSLFVAYEDRSAGGGADLHGAIVDQQAAVTPLGPIDPAPADELASDLDGDATAGYLVARIARSSGTTRVLASRVAPDGTPIDTTPIQVASGSEAIRTPRVAWNGQAWLVVWEVDTGLGGTVFGRLVAADGTLPTGQTTILSGNRPDVAAVGSEFLVAASRLTSLDIRRVWARRVSAAGAATGTQVQIADNFALHPKVVSAAGQWIVVWQQKAAHDSAGGQARFRFVDAAGVPSAQDFATGGSADWLDAAVAMDTTLAITTSDRENARVQRFDLSSGQPVSSGALTLADGVRDEFAVTIGTDGSRFLASWIDFRIHPSDGAGLGDVYSATFDGSGPIVLDDLAVAVDARVPESTGSAAGHGGTILSTYHRFVDDGVHFGWRTFVRRLDTSATCAPDIGSSGPGFAKLYLCGDGFGPGQFTQLQLVAGPPDALTAIVLGVASQPTPLFGGTLIPTPDFTLFGFTDGSGRFGPFGVPGGAPVPFTLFAQGLSLDAAVPGGVVISNALAAPFTP